MSEPGLLPKLRGICERATENHDRLGLIGEPTVALKLSRHAKGEKTRLFVKAGPFGQVVSTQHDASGKIITIAIFKVREVLDMVERLEGLVTGVTVD